MPYTSKASMSFCYNSCIYCFYFQSQAFGLTAEQVEGKFGLTAEQVEGNLGIFLVTILNQG